MDLSFQNIEANACCRCGIRNVRCLCKKCHDKHANPDGTLPQWLKEEQAEAQRYTKRENRRLKRLQEGVKMKKPGPKGGGGNPAHVIDFVSWDQMKAKGQEV